LFIRGRLGDGDCGSLNRSACFVRYCTLDYAGGRLCMREDTQKGEDDQAVEPMLYSHTAS
jgi:hypothetical protein